MKKLAFGASIGLLTLAVLAAEAPGTDIRRDAAVRAIEEVMPSVVNISTETIVEIRDPLENMFREFFGPDWGRRSQQSLGSGVIIDDSGYVLTNLHVVRRANRITVTLADGRVFEAEPLIGTTKTDVALLKLVTKKPEKFSAVRFAADDDLLLGETVLALGNPFGLGGSVTKGILSSKARRPPKENDLLDVADWLQTDAAINPGNSGGPLINLRGELIGINVAVYREGQGIGFAVPVKRVSEALAEIFTPEKIKGLWFGAQFQARPNGLTVTKVQPLSPADKAGLRAGDRVQRVNDKGANNVLTLNRELIAADPRRDIRMTVQRNQEPRNLSIRLVPKTEFFNGKLIEQKLGATLQPLTPQLARSFGIGRVEGLVVADVAENGPAAEAELRPGQIIRSIDGQVPEGVSEAAELLYAKRAGEKVRLELIIRRGRGNIFRLFQVATDVTVR